MAAIRSGGQPRHKAGTTELTERSYEFLRNDKLNARNFFETLPGANKGAFKTVTTVARPRGPIKARPHILLAGFESERDGPARRWRLVCRAKRTLHPPGL